MTRRNLFSGIRIIDLSRVFSGPFATRHFADFGAIVLKIEPPHGDDSRHFPPVLGDWSGYFEVVNRNKESIKLDLKIQRDLSKLYTLCKQADVFVENYSSSVTKRLGIDYKTINRINPRIIYASIHGVSELDDKKYYDAIAQAESGLMSLNGEDHDMKISTSIIDAFSGMKLAFAISSALFYREETGQGQQISISMRGAAFDLLEQNLISTSVSGKNPHKVGNMDSAIAPFGLFRTKNGSIMLAVGNDAIWDRLSVFLKKHNTNFEPKLFVTNIMRLKHLDSLTEQIEFVFEMYQTNMLVKKLQHLHIPCGQVNSMTDVLADQENYDYGLLQKQAHSIVGEIVVPSGGITFSRCRQKKYKESPRI